MTGKELALIESTGGEVDYADPDTVAFIKEKYCPPGVTDLQFKEFLAVAKLENANPLLKEIYLIPYGDKPPQIIFSINWLIKCLEESGKFRGFTLPQYRDKEGKWHEDVWPFDTRKMPPTHCKIGVIRSDSDIPAYGIVSWAERAKYRGDVLQAEWKNQPEHMLCKCAMADAARKSGLLRARYYIQEEMLPTPDAQWINADTPTEEVVKKIEAEKRIRAGELGEPEITIKQGARLKLIFKELDITTNATKLEKINEILNLHYSGDDMPDFQQYTHMEEILEREANLIITKLQEELRARTDSETGQMELEAGDVSKNP